jgi:hypothetical protein
MPLSTDINPEADEDEIGQLRGHRSRAPAGVPQFAGIVKSARSLVNFDDLMCHSPSCFSYASW